MKAAETRMASTAVSRESFFSKGSEQSFFANQNGATDFFSNAAVTRNPIQPNMQADVSNEYLQPAIQAKLNADIAPARSSNTNAPSPTINKFPIQEKCASCEEKEKLSRKEDADGEELDVQAKASSEIQADLHVREKCDKCEEEEKKEKDNEVEVQKKAGIENKVENEEEQIQKKNEGKEEEKEIQPKNDDGTSDPFIQSKCAECEKEDVVQKNEEGVNQETISLQAEAALQLKCKECEDEEKEKDQHEESGIQEKSEKENEKEELVQEVRLSADSPGVQTKCSHCEEEKKEKENEEVDVQNKVENEQKVDKKALPVIQEKLTIGKVGDKYEKQADAVADQTVQRIQTNSVNTQPSGEKVEEEKEDSIMTEPMPEYLQMSAADAPPSNPPPTGNGDEQPYTTSLQRRCRECEEGDIVFRKAIHSIQREGANDIRANGSRESIVALAKSQIGKVEAKNNDGSGKRKGADRLLEYFRIAAPGVWPDDIIETAGAKMPSWCGIFSVWAHKKAGKDIGVWQMGKGVSAFNTLTQTSDPQPGDIGYMDKMNQHHCIVVKVDGNTVHSIDGNSGLFSEVKENTRSRGDYTGFFTAFGSGSSSVQRKEEEDDRIQEKSTGKESGASPDLESRLSSSKGKGDALPESTRMNMESAMGADFSDVKIHTGSEAISMSRELHAQAFTHGSDIYFNAGKYDTHGSSGQHLLSHELTHTVQQGAAVQRKDLTFISREEEEVKPNFDFTYEYRGELVYMSFKLSDASLTRIKSNTDAVKLIKSSLDKVMHYEPNHPVYETPTFLKTSKVRNLLTLDLEVWNAIDEPQLNQFKALIKKRYEAVLNTLLLEAVNNHLLVSGTDPSFIDWNILIPLLKNDVLHWTAKNAIEASEFDQYEWSLDLLAEEVETFDPVVGARPQDAAAINQILFPYIINNHELFSDEVIQAHSEKFVMPWLTKIKEVKFVPDGFDIKAFAPGEEVQQAERSRERLLKLFIKDDVPDLMFKFILDTWTGSGVNPDLWLKNLDIDSYKAQLLDHLAEEFLKKAKGDDEYMKALRLEALEKTKFKIISLGFGAASNMQATNQRLEQDFRKGHKEDLEPNMVAIIEDPANYYQLSVNAASATTRFLSSIQPDRSLPLDVLNGVHDIFVAMQVPEKLSAFALFVVAFGGYIKEYKNAVENERAKVKEAIKDRIKVDYDGIAKVIKNWQKVADEFMEKKFKPMLKTVALEWLAANKKEIEEILKNYDSSQAKFAQQMNESANEVQYVADGLENGEFEEVEYEGQVVTKNDLPQLRDMIQFMRDEANARIDSKKSAEEKGKLKEALEAYDEVKQDIIDDEYDWLDYAKEVFVEARRRLGISEFPEYTTYRDVFSGRVVAEKNPFLAMVIANWYFVDDQERKMWEAFKVVGLGLLTIAAAVIPGAAGFVLAAIDIGVGIGMGVQGVADAKEVLRLAKLDINGTIRGVSVADAEKALKHAWLGLIFTVALTVGPFAVSRALRVRGRGGVLLSKEARAWERTLSKETREALKTNPALRRLYAEMDDAVRRILTLCESPCIPIEFAPKPHEITRIKDFMKQVKVPDNHAGLREYLHHPARRNNLTQAMDDLHGVTNMSQLEKRLDRAVAANVKVPGASSARVNGVWHYTRPDGTVIKEYEIGRHGDLTANRGTSRFFQSHHGIQDAWAMEKGIPGYTRDDCPAILLRDSKMGTPHQVVSARQSGRYSTISSRTYAQERELLKADMKAAGVEKASANKIVQESDAYFGKLYSQIEAKGNKAELLRIFGSWKP